MRSIIGLILLAGVTLALMLGAAPGADSPKKLEADNPLRPLPAPPLGVAHTWEELDDPPTPQRVRLGRWLFFDTRLSKDNTVSCATCHIPKHGFSEPTPVSTGVDGMKGTRKAPPVLNQAWALYPHFFWDGRADSLEAQAEGPMVNPVEMAMANHDAVVKRIAAAPGYRTYFKEAFGDETVTLKRIVRAIADYERTRMSGDSAWDRWQANMDQGDAEALKALEEYEAALASDYGEDDMRKPTFKDGKHVSAEVKLGHALFFGKAQCNQCHLGFNFSDSLFHNLGVGWQPDEMRFKDIGRYEISKKDEDKGAFKTPTVREATLHAPYMHDGSVATLREVVELYNRGGEKNPHLSGKIQPLKLTDEEIDALVAFMEALEGRGYQDTAPKHFPQ